MASYCQGHCVAPQWTPGSGEPFSYSKHGFQAPGLLKTSKGPNAHRLTPSSTIKGLHKAKFLLLFSTASNNPGPSSYQMQVLC